MGEEPKRRPVLRFHAARRVDRRAAVRRRSLRGPAGISVRWCVVDARHAGRFGAAFDCGLPAIHDSAFYDPADV